MTDGPSLAYSAARVAERDDIAAEIARHQQAIATLEARLVGEPAPSWPPTGFYLTFYVVSGILIGILGSLVSFIANVAGSFLLKQDPLLFLRVYGTVFLGARALTTDELDFFMLVAVVHFSVGALAGAVFHVLVNRFAPPRAAVQIALGAIYGLLMWVVNHQVVIAWVQPALVGRPFVLQMMPAWVAIATHLSYGLTLGVLQPLGRFVPYRPPVRATAAVLALACLAVAPALAADSAAIRADGARVYATYCIGCHGERGDGHGAAAEMLITRPRDFTKGVFKFRSTPTGSLPTDDDLFRIVTRGVYRTSMPEWSLLSERERRAVIAYVKGFYPEWETRGAGTPIVVPAAPADLATPERVARGRELYVLLECGACHGPEGRGDGPSAHTLQPDVWGNPQKPFNFTKGRLKSGSAPEDVYRTFMTGLNGTAMPSFADIFAEPDGENIRAGDGWNLVAFILSLRGSAATERESR